MIRKSIRISLVAPALFVAAITATPTIATAADIFMQLEGVEGESQFPNLNRPFELLSYSQSFRALAPAFGGNRAPVCGDVVVTKPIDFASPKLLINMVRAIPTRGVVILRDPVNVNDASAPGYYQIELSRIQVLSVEQLDRPGPPRMVEQVTFRAESFAIAYIPPRESGRSAVSFGWNCARNAPA